ncbi:MAG: TonB-dependent receptor [Cyclobacteriaceae bacterium]
MSSLYLVGQTYTGRVVDIESGLSIAHAQVVTVDSLIVLTEEDGRFEVPSSSITVYALGYLNRSFKLESSSMNEVGLRPNPILLSAVVIQRLSNEVDLQQYSGALSYLSVKTLEHQDRTIITNALNSQTGIYMHSGTLNTNRITVRGIGARSPFSTNKVRAYFGDIPLTDGIGETTIEDIDMSAIGEVTIFKGPNSSIYGAGLGGAIQLQPDRLTVGTREVYGSIGSGSYGLKRGNVGFQMRSEKHEFRVAYSRQTSDGYRDNNEFERNGVQLNASWHLPKASYSLMAYYVNQFAEIPSSLNEDDYLNEPRKAAFTWGAAQGYEDYNKLIAGLTADHELTSRSTLKTTLYTQWRDAYEPRPFNILDEQVFGLGLRSRYQYEMSSLTIINIGFEGYQDQYDWQTYQNLYQDFPGQGSVQGELLSQFSEQRSFFNGFAEWQQQIADQWSLTAGLNINRTRYELADLISINGADQSGDYSFDWNVSPRVALAYIPSSSMTIYGSVSHGFSPPSLGETLTPEGSINPQIQPETGWSYEVGGRGSFLQDRLGYDISIYSMRIRNLLVAQRVAEDQYVGVNAGSTTHNGLEVGLHALLWSGMSSSAQLSVHGTINDFKFKEFVDGENNYSGNDLTGVPASQWSAGFDMEFLKRCYTRLEFLSVGEMPITDDNSIYSDSYQLVNAVVGWKPVVSDKLGLDLSYRINNLLDEGYASMLAVNAGSFGGTAPRYYYPGLPIFHQVSLKFRWHW